jgi:hypothetical protein
MEYHLSYGATDRHDSSASGAAADMPSVLLHQGSSLPERYHIEPVVVPKRQVVISSITGISLDGALLPAHAERI